MLKPLDLMCAVSEPLRCVLEHKIRFHPNSLFYFMAVAFIALLAQSAQAKEKEQEGGLIVLGTDERVPSNDPMVARFNIAKDSKNSTCTAWLISNGAFLSAGHCFVPHGQQTPTTNCPMTTTEFDGQVEFNGPLSNTSGTKRHGTPNNKYNIDNNFSHILCQRETDPTSRISSDWGMFKAGTNSLGDYPITAQGAFYRLAKTNTLGLVVNKTRIRVAGYGVDGPAPQYGVGGPRNRYSVTQQQAAGAYLGSNHSNGFSNIIYNTDSMPGDSGAPASINGSGVAVGIHVIGAPTSNPPQNRATSFRDDTLEAALDKFPGIFYSPPIPADLIFYVDQGTVEYKETPSGKFFKPYLKLTDAFNAVGALDQSQISLINIVAGNYPGVIDETTGVVDNIDLSFASDVNFEMPVGDVVLWGLTNGPEN
jgi:V8-like Glu-specific endopeptidase